MKGSTVPIRKNRPSVLVWKGLAWERKTEDWLAAGSGVGLLALSIAVVCASTNAAYFAG